MEAILPRSAAGSSSQNSQPKIIANTQAQVPQTAHVESGLLGLGLQPYNYN